MAGVIKTQVTKVQTNMLGAIVGVIAGYYAAGKYAKVRNKYARVGIAIATGVGAAHVQSMIMAKRSEKSSNKAAK